MKIKTRSDLFGSPDFFETELIKPLI